MNQAFGWAAAQSRSPGIIKTAFADLGATAAVDVLARALGDDPMALIILFVSPNADVAGIIEQASDTFAPVPVVGCTTAGELTDQGYSEDQIVALGLPSSHFETRSLLIPDLDDFDAQEIIDEMIRNRDAMMRSAADWDNEFTFLMIDGLSTKEDKLTSELAVGLGPVPLFGGSAGDGINFGHTYILHDRKALENAAILVQVRTRCPIRVFKTDHLVPATQRLIVTKADPARRVVQEINAEPAAREYARVLGKDPEQLTSFTFAAHPVVVQIGGQHHVRAIQQVASNGDLVFYSAIDEGLVLTLAKPRDMAAHLQEEIAALNDKQKPDMILACDCILRRLEAEEKQTKHALSRILRRNRVVGFSTYGEQYNSIHVNQTMTGVAIYPPEDD